MKSIFFILGIIAASQPPQQFDLVCKGITVITSVGSPGSSKPYEKRYRLDIAKGKYCIDACIQGQSDLPEVTDRLIYLEKVKTTGRDAYSVSNFVNRQTGEHFALAIDDRLGINSKGKCEPQPFSGFPQLKTKF